MGKRKKEVEICMQATENFTPVTYTSQVCLPTLVLKPAYCKTSTFQASFFNRIVKPWNTLCKLASPDKFSSLSIFKDFLHAAYYTLLDTTFDIGMSYTWFLSRNCPCNHS